MNRSYICFHGNQYSTLKHILPTNQHAIAPIDRRPTLKGNHGCIENGVDNRNITFIDSHENMANSRIFDTRASGGPYHIYSSAIDIESDLRSLGNYNTRDLVLRQDDKTQLNNKKQPQSVFRSYNMYNDSNMYATAYNEDTEKHFGCSIEDKYGVRSTNQLFNNNTRAAVYKEHQ
jgi:hypothetical protein